ncbi:MAG: hypothetical protein IKX88_03220 [Thermoguttaceae bacterium]|nr:hypothetical protein [Thermoguttaceae bacterium]
MKKTLLATLFVAFLWTGFGIVAHVASDAAAQAAETKEREFYKPKEFEQMDFNDEQSRWCFQRSRKSEHFIVFWESGFGADPNSADTPEKMRVDVDDLLAKAETFYRTNVERLGFCQEGKSALDRYRLEIYLLWQEEWLATGAGYDNVIGALWVNPSTCQPVGATIGHEIGHSFQYQVYCDHLLNGAAPEPLTGFRYAHDTPRPAAASSLKSAESDETVFDYNEDGMGNTIWEQCANWQAYQDYPENAFEWFYPDVWFPNCNRAFENEWMRYQSYWLLYAIKDLHGADAIGKVWNAAVDPEDFLDCYLRVFCGGDVERLNDELYFYASRCVTFDFDDARDFITDNWRDRYRTVLYPTENEKTMRVAYADCPDETGFNAIPLDPARYVDGVAKIRFKALEQGAALAEDDPGEYFAGGAPSKVAGTTRRYNVTASDVVAEHRYGFVAQLEDGSRVYGEANKGAEKEISFAIPERTKRLWFVVVGAASKHRRHVWNEKELDDLQLPYEITFVN